MDFENLIRREINLSKYRGDLFTEWLGLPLSLPITRFFLSYNISENTASVLMWIVGITGAVLILLGPIFKIFGLILIISHYILDYVDGQLARERKTASLKGAVLDRWNHYTLQMLFYIMLAFNIYREYGSAILMIPVFIFIFWNQFRNLIANMPALIYCNELNGYDGEEVEIIHNNYESTVRLESGRTEENRTCEESAAPTENRPSWRVKIRSASTSFDFLIMSLLVATSCEVILTYLTGISLDLDMILIMLFAAYYLYNFYDFSKEYLFSDRIYENVKKLERKLKS